MADRPILFRGPLVRAILDGRKTVTRRLCSVQPRLPGVTFAPDPAYPGEWLWGTPAETLGTLPCPYGVPGDTLWVKEAHAIATGHMYDGEAAVRYFADCSIRSVTDERSNAQARSMSLSRGRPSIHMPRWASRLTLHVVSVRAERLRDIDDADAMREGIEVPDVFGDMDSYNRQSVPGGVAVLSARDAEAVRLFRDLWDSINGKRPGASWDANPWVWRVEFRRAVDFAGGAS